MFFSATSSLGAFVAINNVLLLPQRHENTKEHKEFKQPVLEFSSNFLKSLMAHKINLKVAFIG